MIITITLEIHYINAELHSSTIMQIYLEITSQ